VFLRVYAYVHASVRAYACIWKYACLYVCMYVCMFVCMYVSMYVYTFKYSHALTPSHMQIKWISRAAKCVCVYVCVLAYGARVCVRHYTCVCVYLRVCMCVCMYVCIYEFTHTYTHAHTPSHMQIFMMSMWGADENRWTSMRKRKRKRLVIYLPQGCVRQQPQKSHANGASPLDHLSATSHTLTLHANFMLHQPKVSRTRTRTHASIRQQKKSENSKAGGGQQPH